MNRPSTRLVPLLLCVSVLGALPPASAQTEPLYDFSLDVTQPEDLVPVGERVERTVSLTLWCLSPAAAASSPIPFEANVTAGHADLQVTVTPSTLQVPIDPAACVRGERVNVTLNVTVQAGMGPVAGERVPLNMTVRSGELVREATWGEATEPVLATTATFDHAHFKTGPNSRLMLPVRVENAGNSDVMVAFEPAQGNSPELNFALPGPFVVPRDPGRTAIPVDVQSPFQSGYMEQVDELVLNVHVSWPNDPAFKQTLAPINATIETVGTYLPGPGAVLAAAAMVGVLALVRRRVP